MSLALTVSTVACALRPTPSWTPPTGLRVTFLDVGQGDSALVEAPGGAVLVDEGPPEADVAGQLRRLGLRSLTAIVLTHPQRDHIGGAARVLDRLSVGAVGDPGIEAPSPDRDAALAEARRRGVPVVVVHAGEVFRIGELKLRILWPDDPGLPSEDPNQHAVVALASYGATDVLLTADAESDVTSRLPLRPVEVLKVAHHGSEDPGLARPSPRSASEDRRDLRRRAQRLRPSAARDARGARGGPGLETLRTDENGRIVVESDGRTLTVRSER